MIFSQYYSRKILMTSSFDDIIIKITLLDKTSALSSTLNFNNTHIDQRCYEYFLFVFTVHFRTKFVEIMCIH